MYPELKKVLQYIVDKISAQKLPELYSQLAQDYEKVASSSTPELEEAIKTNSKVIEEIQKTIEPLGFDLLSLHTFQKLDENDVLGADAINRFTAELSQISNNPRAASTAIQNMANQLTKLRDTSKATIENLNNLWGEATPIEAGYVELQVVFDDQVAIKNFKTMREQADFWNEMLLLANQALGDGSVDHQIVALYKINPSGVTFKTKLVYASLILPIVSSSLDIANNLLGFKQTEKTIIVLPISEEKRAAYCDQLKSDEQEALTNKIEEETTKIIDQVHDILPAGEEAKHESESDTRIMIKKMYNFTLGGGAVSVVNVSEEDKTKIYEPSYQLPESFKLLQKTRERLENPKLPPALLSPEEKEKLKPRNLAQPAVAQTPIEVSQLTPKRRGRPSKAKHTTE